MSSNSYKIILVALLVVIGLATIFYLVARKPPQESTPLAVTAPSSPGEVKYYQVIPVVASKDKLDPNSFTIPHLKSVLLEIQAIDKDYEFKSEDLNIDVKLPQGETTQVRINAIRELGVYNFSCSSTCTGSIEIVEGTEDEASEAN